MTKQAIIFLHLGSNIGKRLAYIEKAIALIQQLIGTIIATSNIYETAAWGKQNQASFLNQAIQLNSTLSPIEVLDKIHFIENLLGRTRSQKWAARTIDIDILFYNHDIINSDRLIIPHQYLQDRQFVLVPMLDIAPDWNHPVLNQSIAKLQANCKDKMKVETINPIAS